MLLNVENLREEYEKRIQQSEQNWSQQISSTRATLELVKEQLQRETEAQLEALNKKYLLQLGKKKVICYLFINREIFPTSLN